MLIQEQLHKRYHQKGIFSPLLGIIILIIILAIAGVYLLFSAKRPNSNLSTQTPKGKIYKVAILVGQDAHVPAYDGFKQKMIQLGYVEGENISYDYRNGKGETKLLDTYAQELISKNPDIIVTSSTSATKPVIKLTSTIPIVFLAAGNVSDLVPKQPFSGTNVTGISTESSDTSGKRLELLTQINPKLKSVALVYNPTGGSYKKSYDIAIEAAKKLGLSVSSIEVASKEEALQKVKLINPSKAESLLLLPSGGISTAAQPLIDEAIKQKVYTACITEESANKGCLVSQDANYQTLGAQGALMVDKVLKGSQPGEIAIEKASKLDLIINLKSARTMNITIPSAILESADKIIE
ncbi:ABC transporter substrate-binding protein [Candidatus Daviesbacteria bacterium]|nr:ABC transporter substrate-binding protein [Candidatus Daviesbacteria bacterium]